MARLGREAVIGPSRVSFTYLSNGNDTGAVVQLRPLGIG